MQVILATDGSVESDIATAAFKRLPLKDGEISVVSVTKFPVVAPIGIAAGIQGPIDVEVAGTWRLERKVARQMVEKVADDLRLQGFSADALLLEGETADELLKLIKEQTPELVLAGCGLSNSASAFFLGSITRKLLFYSESSVLIGRSFAEEPPEGSCRRIRDKAKLDLLIAVDGSAGSEMAIESLASLKTPVFGDVYVATVEPYSYMPPGTDLSIYMPISEADKEKIQAVASQAAERIASCADNVQTLTSLGRPSAEIAAFAKDKDVDLVILGANRHGAMERIVLGSCAYETALSAPCSVLVLRDVLPFEE